jgi:hypothetical protein
MARADLPARARISDPCTPQMTEPLPQPELRVADSVMLAARSERAAQEQDPVRLAAIARRPAATSGVDCCAGDSGGEARSLAPVD